jgi:hypothetical protein
MTAQAVAHPDDSGNPRTAGQALPFASSPR